MSTNINDINTVSDLLKVQEPVSDDVSMSPLADHITNLILAEEPCVGMEVCARVLYALREFHAQGVEMYIEEGKAEFSAQWASDHAKLDTALSLIKDIQV